MGTLRSRLALSHIIPFCLIVPLMGIALIYFLQTQVLLPSLANDLREETGLAVRIADQQPQAWSSPSQAQALADDLDPTLTARIMLLDPNMDLLASTDPADDNLIGQKIVLRDLEDVQPNSASVRINSSLQLQSEVVDAVAPVDDGNGQIIGFVRLTHQLGGIYDQLSGLRYLIAAVLVAGLLVGASVGVVLSLNIERPLDEATRAISEQATGRRLSELPEQGPHEVRTLLHAFNLLAERLQDLEQTRSQLLANLVHEIGRPLGAFYSATQALLRGADEDPALRRDLLVGMEREVQSMRRLLDDLTSLYNSVSGRFALKRQPLDLGEWLPAVLAPWRETAKDKNLAWQVTLPASLPTLTVDADRLSQALGNLVSNAIKYTPAKGAVAIKAGQTPTEIWISVSDTGPGMSAEQQSHIFEPFFRGVGSALYPEGMGLGLGITRELILAHDGRLELQSAPGSGSTITIWLPVNSSQQSAVSSPHPTFA